VSRSLRHPFGGSRHYLRPEKNKGPRRKKVRQPKIHQGRFSVEGVLDAPDSTVARPGLRLRITGLIVLGLFAVLGLRLWALTVLQAPAAAHAVSVNQIRTVPVDPTRGLILDRYGNPLVGNQVVEEITLSRVAAAQHPEVIGRLAALIGQTPAQVQASIADTRFSVYKPVPVASGDDATMLPMILYVREHSADFPGVSSVTTTERDYPQVELPGPAAAGYPASQTLGYVGTINGAELKSRASQGYQAGDPFGQAGLEYQYESELRGTPGRSQLEVDAKGQVVGTLKTTSANPGDNLVTNIDTNLQQVADNALATQVTTLRGSYDKQCNNGGGCYPAATEGAVVVMSPQTGAVYAMSSYPSYNLREWIGGLSAAQNNQLFGPTSLQPTLNRAIQGVYIPGSTFKLNTATAALDTGLISPSFSYNDTGSFKTPDCLYNSTTCNFHNSTGEGGFGEINVSTALTVSSDDFFYNLGYLFYARTSQYGQTPIQDQAAQYGLGELTGIDLPEEAKGRVDSQPEEVKLHALKPKVFPNTTWYTGQNIEMAFGQGGTYITPIEQAVAYSTFANGGTRYAPQVAAAVVSPSGTVVKRFAPQVTGHVAIPAQNYQALLTGFEGVVNKPNPNGGTAYGVPGLASFPGGVAGKTGTADTVPKKEPTAWFVGWGPTASAAQYVVVCVIDQAGFGVTGAAPVVGQIFSYLASHPVTAPGIPPAQSNILRTTPIAPPSLSPTTTTRPSTATTTTTTTTSGATG
jgi:penicillin-binding protein 2